MKASKLIDNLHAIVDHTNRSLNAVTVTVGEFPVTNMTLDILDGKVFVKLSVATSEF